MTGYLLDTDVFIRAKNQHYGFDLCPGFWNWIDREHVTGKVFSIQGASVNPTIQFPKC